MTIKPVQKQSSAGQRTRFKAYVAVGDFDGHIGLGKSRIRCRNQKRLKRRRDARSFFDFTQSALAKLRLPSAARSSWPRCTSCRSAAATGGPRQRQKGNFDALVAFERAPLTGRFYTVKIPGFLTRSP